MSELERTNKTRNTLYAIHRSRHAFTLVEILIAVAILGILAAIALPTFQGHIAEARESAAKDNLRILRNTIELYAAQHNGISPAYPLENTNAPATLLCFYTSIVKDENYLSEIPANPFNNLATIHMIQSSESFPDAPTGEYGWIYKPAIKEFRIDWPGTDKKGIPYYNY